MILDGGTGLRPLGETLGRPLSADILLSHCHIDHISGLPFFAPFYDERNAFRIWAGNLLPRFSLNETLRRMMSVPLFPIQVESFHAEVDYRDFEAGDDVPLGDGISVRTMALNHPDGATGYRLTYQGKSVAYITDHEALPGAAEPDLVAFVRNADLVIYDSTYTDEEIEIHRGWGHSTWSDAVALAEAADIRTMCLFHHDPAHDDAFMDRIACAVKQRRPSTIVAREGLRIEL